MLYFVAAIFLLSYPYGLDSKPQYERNGVGYYWRDYEGYIPSDALQVAPNKYIGQVFADGVLKPAHIDALQKHAEYLHDEQVHTTHHQVKILCSTDPSQFEWVKTDSAALMRLLPERYTVPGGRSNTGKPLLIGRSHNSHVVGIVTIYSENDGLHYPFNGKGVHANEFDVFLYKSH